MASIRGSGRSPGGGHGNPLQYSCLENPIDREAWWATVHGVTELNTTEVCLACMHQAETKKVLVVPNLASTWKSCFSRIHVIIGIWARNYLYQPAHQLRSSRNGF